MEHQPEETPIPQPIVNTTTGLSLKNFSGRKKLIVFFGLGALLVLLLTIIVGASWYAVQLSPVDSKKADLIKVTITSGSSPSKIGGLLKQKGIIRDTTAFSVYTRLSMTQNNLQAGTYRLSPSETTPEIVKHLTNGTVDAFKLTFLPGATLAQNKEVLMKAGYSSDEINAALIASYDSPLFDGKPASSDLEGYIYGETYSFGSGAAVKDIFIEVFREYAQVVKDNNLTAKFKLRGLSLYQGITLASIVQRESIKGDEPQIAQVFYSRLAMNMPLGSDVTYQYIADKTGLARDPNLNSPYNTRRFAGLPPGPIAVPGKSSLLATATPASGDYLFFLSGDDDITYYARTLSQHEANIAAHCKVKCSIL